MVIGRVARRYFVQRMATRAKPYIRQYVKREYGEIAGLAAGVAISVGVGDYSGAFRDFGRHLEGRRPNSQNPPFGFFDGTGTDGVNGSGNGAFHQTLLPTNVNKRYNRKYRGRNTCFCRGRKQQKPKFRSRRR